MLKIHNVITFERFFSEKYCKKSQRIVLLFAILFFLFGAAENNLFLLGNSIGFLEHINIQIFLGINLLVPFVLNKIHKQLENNIASSESFVLKNLQNQFEENQKKPIIQIVFNLFTLIGFLFFVGNSLQNAYIINRLDFDFWDSINYVWSYIISRAYKFYLFTLFIPQLLIYDYLLIKTLSELISIEEKERENYPLKNYIELNMLCNFGLNVILITIAPIICIVNGIYLLHNRVDLTTTSTIIVTVISVSVSFYMYFLMIQKYRIHILSYKNKHLKRIDNELVNIHNCIVDYDVHFNESPQLFEMYLQKEKYLQESRERVEKISNFPLIVKAILTCLSPAIPMLINLLQSFLKSFL